ncbi:MAG: class I SAM-dependent methyltransferase [Kiritimatiellia bacterium]
MNNFSNRIHVLWSLLTLQSKDCPYCRGKKTRRIGCNSPLSHVRECEDCRLIYRWPKQDARFNHLFYQLSYIRLASDNMQLPTPAEAAALAASDFRGHATAMGVKRDLVTRLQPGGRLCVYGANWGYEVSQLARAGFDAIGYEISKPRAEFARHLGVTVVTEWDAVRARAPFDVIYCSHTLEHLPSPQGVFDFFSDICAPTGCLVLFVPNCGGAEARRLGVKWGPFSSSLHPLSLRAEFFKHALPRHGFESVSAFSDPYDPGQVREPGPSGELNGDELLIVARRRPVSP